MDEFDILEELYKRGVDLERVQKTLDNDYFGQLVNAYEVVTILGIVEVAMKKDKKNG